MALVEDLKILLKKKNYSVTSVAKAVNLSNATLHLWMNNNYKGNVKKIEDAVEVWFADFVVLGCGLFFALIEKLMYKL